MKIRPRDNSRDGEAIVELDNGVQVKATVSLRHKRVGAKVTERTLVVRINGGALDEQFVQMATELGVYIADTRSP